MTAEYRLYFLDKDLCQIAWVEELAASSDETAVNAALARRGEEPMELWSGARMVKRFEASDHASKLIRRWQAKRQMREQDVSVN